MKETGLAVDPGVACSPPSGRQPLPAVRGPAQPRGDLSLPELVLAYRDDRAYGGRLLELLAPAIAFRLRFLRPQPPVITFQDLRQQLVLEVLLAASTIPIPIEAHLIERRIMARAGWRMTRWLDRELEHSEANETLDEDSSDEGAAE